MQRHALGALAVTLAVAAAACDAGGDHSSPAPATPAPATPAPSSPAPAASPYPDLSIPAAEHVLVPVMHGTGAADTPPFPVRGMKYAVWIVCTGKGTITIDAEDMKNRPCDGATRRAHIITGDKTAVVPIRPHGSVRWSVAVVDDDNFHISDPGSGIAHA
jgi:hypothetical protein